jgi:hypothetical protein
MQKQAYSITQSNVAIPLKGTQKSQKYPSFEQLLGFRHK